MILFLRAIFLPVGQRLWRTWYHTVRICRGTPRGLRPGVSSGPRWWGRPPRRKRRARRSSSWASRWHPLLHCWPSSFPRHSSSFWSAWDWERSPLPEPRWGQWLSRRPRNRPHRLGALQEWAQAWWVRCERKRVELVLLHSLLTLFLFVIPLSRIKIWNNSVELCSLVFSTVSRWIFRKTCIAEKRLILFEKSLEFRRKSLR